MSMRIRGLQANKIMADDHQEISDETRKKLREILAPDGNIDGVMGLIWGPDIEWGDNPETGTASPTNDLDEQS